MSKSGVESYFRHYHLQDLLDHFVATFVEDEQQRKEIESRAYLLKNTLTTDVPEESADVDGDAAASADANKPAAINHPQQKAIRALRAFLEAHARGHDEWRADYRYVVLIPSAVPPIAASTTSPSAGSGHDATVRVARACAQQLAAEHNLAAVELPGMAHPAGSGGSKRDSVMTSNSLQQQQSFSSQQKCRLTDVMLAHEDLDEGDIQKLLDAFRLVTAEKVREQLRQSAKGTAVVVASQWPRSVADALVMEHILGQPQGVLYLHDASCAAPAGGDGDGCGGDEETAVECEELARVIGTERREAGFVDPSRERAALLAYYGAVRVLHEVTVPPGEEAIAVEKVMGILNEGKSSEAIDA